MDWTKEFEDFLIENDLYSQFMTTLFQCGYTAMHEFLQY